MKKGVKLSKKTRRLIIKNLIVLLTLGIVAFVGVFSWFRLENDSDASGIVVSTLVGDGLEFYVMPPSDSDQYNDINTRLADNATWNAQNPSATPRRIEWHKGGNEVDFDFADQEFKFMEGLFMCEVTSDGKTFQVPKLMQYDEVAYVDTTQDFDPADPNDEYMSFDLYFRSENQHDVKLVYDSVIAPNETYPAGTYSNPGDTKKAAAIGAVRMSILNGNTRELLWIPGASVYYDGLQGEGGTLYTGLTDFSNKGAVYYTGSGIDKRTNEGTDTHAYYASKTVRNVLRSTTSGLEGTLVASGVGGQLGATSASDLSVVTLNHQDTTNGYYYGHIRVNLWIEGEDAEARLGFVGGKFNMTLSFAFAD